MIGLLVVQIVAVWFWGMEPAQAWLEGVATERRNSRGSGCSDQADESGISCSDRSL